MVSDFLFCLDRVCDNRSNAKSSKRIIVPTVHAWRFLLMNRYTVKSAIEGQHVSADQCEDNRESENVHFLSFLSFILPTEMFENSMSLFFLAIVFIVQIKTGALHKEPHGARNYLYRLVIYDL